MLKKNIWDQQTNILVSGCLEKILISTFWSRQQANKSWSTVDYAYDCLENFEKWFRFTPLQDCVDSRTETTYLNIFSGICLVIGSKRNLKLSLIFLKTLSFLRSLFSNKRLCKHAKLSILKWKSYNWGGLWHHRTIFSRNWGRKIRL